MQHERRYEPYSWLLRQFIEEDELPTVQNDTGFDELFVTVIFDHVNGRSL